MREAEVILELPVPANVEASFDPGLEVSLDCNYCKRTQRTVVFKLGEHSARCIHRIPEKNVFPSAEAHRNHKGRIYGPSEINVDPDRKPVIDTHPPYPGRIVDLDVTRSEDGAVTAIYRLEYETSPFEDIKHGSRMRPWTGHPTWARAYFLLTCPKCSAVYDGSVQNNTVRPCKHECDCGYTFFIERRELPRLRWLDPESDNWVFVPERFDAGSNWKREIQRLWAVHIGFRWILFKGWARRSIGLDPD